MTQTHRPPTLVLITILLYFAATLTPRNESPRWALNHVEQTPAMASFPRPGLLRSSDHPEWIEDAIRGRALNLALAVVPLSSDQSGPARIFTASADTTSRNLTVGQDHEDLVLRVRRDPGTVNGTPPFVVPGVFHAGRPARIEIAMDERGVVIRVDGTPRLETAWTSPDPFQFWDPRYPVALGNELTWDRPWLGHLRSAVLTTPTATTDLLAPGILAAPFGAWLGPPFTWVSRDWLDLLLNFLLMLPAGAVTSFVLQRWKPLRVVMFWMPVVLLAESLQFLIPGRFPAASDVMLNLMGVLIGGHLVASARTRSSPDRRDSGGPYELPDR